MPLITDLTRNSSVDTENNKRATKRLAMDSRDFTRALTRLDIMNFGKEAPETRLAGDTSTAHYRNRCKVIIEHKAMRACSMIATIVALFASDIQRLAVPPAMDVYIQYLLTSAFGFFVLELVLSVGADPRHWKSLFFWLDLVATFSLVPDLPWLVDLLQQMFDGPTSAESLTVARAGRAAKVGARAGRMGKMARLLRLTRLLRVLKMFRFDKRGHQEHRRASSPDIAEFMPAHTHLEADSAMDSVVPETMARDIALSVSRRVVVFVLLAIVIASLLSYYEVDRAEELAFKLLYSSENTTQALRIVDEMLHDTLLFARVHNIVTIDRRDQGNVYRTDETRHYVTGSKCCEAIFLSRPELVDQAWENITLIFCIIILLSVSSFLLSKDAMSVVQHPMQQVMRATSATAALLDVFKAVSDLQQDDEVEELVTIITDALHKVLYADIANLYFLDEATDTLWCQHGGDRPSTPRNDDLRIPLGCGIVGKAALTNSTVNEVYVSGACPTDPSFDFVQKFRSGNSSNSSNDVFRKIAVRHVLCMPIRADNKTIGVVSASCAAQ